MKTRQKKNAWQQTVFMCGFFRIYTLFHIRNAGMIKNHLFKCQVSSCLLSHLYETLALNI